MRKNLPGDAMSRLSCLVSGLLLAVLLAACASGSSNAGDDGKSHGFYGGLNGGWTEPRPQ